MMALQNLLSQLRHKGLQSSSAIRSVHFCGVGTSLWKSTLLPPLMPSTQLFHSLPGFVPYPPSESGDSQSFFSYDEENPERPKLFRVTKPVLRYGPKISRYQKVLQGEALARQLMRPAVYSVRGSVVGLTFIQDCEAPMVFSGTVVRADGIVATSSDCWRRYLKGSKYEIGVKIMGCWEAYKGVLLHTDSVSKIAFVKILCYEGLLPVPKCRKLDSPRKGGAVTAFCTPSFGSWMNTKFSYHLGSFRSATADITNDATASRYIEDDTENTEFHNARTSGQLIEAQCGAGEHVIGGALASLAGGILGVIHNTHGSNIQATPIEDVLKYLKYLEKDGYGTREHAKDIKGA